MGSATVPGMTRRTEPSEPSEQAERPKPATRAAGHTEHKSLHEVPEQAPVVEAPETKVKVTVKNWFRDEDGTLHGPSDDPDAVVELPASYARRLGRVYVEPVE